MLRVAVVGAGSVGTRHIGNLLDLGCHVDVWESDERRRAAAAQRFPDARCLDRWSSHVQCDAMVVASPYISHLAWAVEVERRGCALFIEKPLGDPSQLSLWRHLAAQMSNRVTQVGYQCRFHQVAQAMKLLQPAESGFFATACDMRTWPGKAYGPLLLEASHDLDLALHMGAPSTVTEATIDPHYVAIQLGPHWRVTLEDRADYRREWTVEQRGQSMSVTFDRPEALGTLAYYDEMRHFIECVSEHRQTDCPLSAGVRVLDVASQVEQMARRAA